MSSHRSFSQLAAGAALCMTSLASAGSSQPSDCMKVTGSYLKLVENGVYGTWTSPSSWQNLNGGAGYNYLDPTGASNPTTTPWGNAAAGGNALTSLELDYGYTLLMFQGQVGTGITTAGGTATGWIDVVFTADATLDPFNFWTGGLSVWSVGGTTVTGGETFTQGQSVRFGFSYVWPSATNGVSQGLLFTSGTPGGVPLPGAAGLAACGLVGLSRRRRRR